MNEALGLRAPSRLAGFLALGTPTASPEPITAAQRPQPGAHVVEWTGPLPIADTH